MTIQDQQPRGDLSALRIERTEEDHNSTSGSRAGKFAGWAIAILVVAALAWAAYNYLILPRSLPVVEVAEVRATIQAANAPTLSATGYLVADRRAQIGPPFSGRVIQLNFDTGSKVRKGDPLAVIQSDQIQAQQRMAEATLADAKREHQRQLALWKDGVTSRSLLDSAESRMKIARAQLEEVQVSLRDSIVRAPFDGTITAKNTEIGEIVSPVGYTSSFSNSSGGGSIGSLADLTTIEVEADVNEGSVGRLREGHPAEITVDAYPGKRWRGTLRKIIPTADRAKGVVKVKVAFADPAEGLLPDMSATASFLETARTDAELTEKPKIWIPESAVITESSVSRVLVLGEGNDVSTRTVTPGDVREGRVEIRDGLREGDKVVTSGGSDLKSGQKVRLNEESK